jgi:uncharacterized membrane protein
LIDALLNFLNSFFGTSYFGKCAVTFIISMLPVIELRGAIPVAATLGLPPFAGALVSIVGNMLPVPFIVIFSRRFFNWMRKKSKRLGRLADRFENRAKAKGARLYSSQILGLMIFVALPLPGTGPWTGALIAAFLDIRLKTALPSIGAGVVAASILVSGITYGFKSLLF